jgi:hypothetical protein
MGEHCNSQQCFKKKNYETKFSTSSIWRKKIDKDNYGKKNHKKIKKNHVRKHCSNPQRLKEKKTTKLNLQPVPYFKKIKLTKTILKK